MEIYNGKCAGAGHGEKVVGEICNDKLVVEEVCDGG